MWIGLFLEDLISYYYIFFSYINLLKFRYFRIWGITWPVQTGIRVPDIMYVRNSVQILYMYPMRAMQLVEIQTSMYPS